MKPQVLLLLLIFIHFDYHNRISSLFITHSLLVHYTGKLEDGRIVDNTYGIMEPHTFLVGKNTSIIPGLEKAIKKMNFTEKAIVVVKPKYGYFSLKLKKQIKKILHQERIDLMKAEEKKLKKKSNDPENPEEEVPEKPKEEEPEIPNEPEKPINELEPNIAKYYSTITYEVELIKHDAPRKTRQQLQPEGRIEEACMLKEAGNTLFKAKNFREAIVRYKDGFDFLIQMPTDDLTSKVVELRSQFLLNQANCHLALLEYNYALKRCEEAIKYKITPKCHYYQAVSEII